MNQDTLKRLIDIAAGRRNADLVLRNAEILNVFTNRWQRADLAICGETIAGIGCYRGDVEIDLSGKHLVPGFIDAHLHLESTMTSPPQLVCEVVPWGTTTMIADPHEVANVSGAEGISYMIEQTENLPCNIYIMLPSCVPSTPWEDSGAVLDAQELSRFKGHPRILGLGEVMDYIGVTSANDDMLQKLTTFEEYPRDGHAPMLSGQALQAYRAAGIMTDHEASTADETVEKIEAGLYLLAREGSAAKNVEVLMRAAVQHELPFDRFAFCTDDKHIEDIRRNGHIGENIRIAIAAGVPITEVYKMASLYGAQIYGLSHLGALCAGYQADIVVLDDVATAKVASVYYKGSCVPGSLTNHLKPSVSSYGQHSVQVKPVTADDMSIPYTGGAYPVIELVPNQIVTRKSLLELPSTHGFFTPNREFAKLLCIERHHASGKMGRGVVRGFNLHGALATTVGHDSHNLLVLGDSDSDILLALETVVGQGGGYVLVQEGRVMGSLPLPVFGLIADCSIDELLGTLTAMKQTAHEMGIPHETDPFITASFLALPVIPELRITDRGLFDVTETKFIHHSHALLTM